MIKEEDYLKAKQIVQEYEKQLNISDVIFRSKQFFVEMDFGYYSVGCFDGFEDGKVKLKISEDSYLLCSSEDLFESKHPTMMYLHKYYDNGI